MNDSLLEKLISDSRKHSVNFKEDNLFFIGNWHDAFPRALIFDPLLQCTDKCVYQLLRTYISATGASRMPSYDEIGRYLNISRGTVSKSLHILRATGWITLCNALRDQDNGRFKGNLYAIHDEALGVHEASQLDGRYLEALTHMESHHPHLRVRSVAHAILESIRRQLDAESLEQPDNLSRLMNRFVHGHKLRPGMHQNTRVQNLDAEDIPVQNSYSGERQVQILYSDKKNKEKQKDNIQVQKMDSANKLCSSSYINNKTTTTNQEQEKINYSAESAKSSEIDPKLVWPGTLLPDEKWLAWQILSKCPEEIRQDLLDEVGARTRPNSPSPIKNIVGWLGWAHNALREGEIFPITSNAFKYRRMREQTEALNKRQSNLTRNPYEHQSATNPPSQEVKANFRNNLAELKAALKKPGNSDLKGCAPRTP